MMEELKEMTAKEAFERFQAPTNEVGEATAKQIVEKAKESPQAGAIAFLHKDEDEAIDGYLKVQVLFKDCPRALEVFHSIIQDEIRHKKMLQELASAYIIEDKDNQEALKKTEGNIDKARGEVAKPSESVL